MPNYIYNIGTTDSRTRTSGVTWYREPQAFPGTAQEFAETMLRDLIAADPRMAGEYITVKVWDNDREGPGDFAHVAAYTLNNPEEPRRPDEISVDFFQYYVASADYEVADDAVLGGDGTQWSLGIRAGLIVPSDHWFGSVRPMKASALNPGYLTIRVSARGRDANRRARGRNPGQPREQHRIEAWPADEPGPRLVLKRDQTSRYWEEAGAITPP